MAKLSLTPIIKILERKLLFGTTFKVELYAVLSLCEFIPKFGGNPIVLYEQSTISSLCPLTGLERKKTYCIEYKFYTHFYSIRFASLNRQKDSIRIHAFNDYKPIVGTSIVCTSTVCTSIVTLLYCKT